MRAGSSSGFTLVEVITASALAAVLMAGVLAAAGAVTRHLRQSEQMWLATEAVSQVLDQWRTCDAACTRGRDGWRLAVDEAGALSEITAGEVPMFTLVIRGTAPAGWPTGAVRVEACAYRGGAREDEPALVCLQSGVRGML